MKAKLIFDLDDFDDRMSHLAAVKAQDMAIVLWDIQHNAMRKIIGDMDSPEYQQGVEDAIGYARDLMNDNGIVIDELTQ